MEHLPSLNIGQWPRSSYPITTCPGGKPGAGKSTSRGMTASVSRSSAPTWMNCEAVQQAVHSPHGTSASRSPRMAARVSASQSPKLPAASVSGSAIDEAGHPVRDERRLVLALDLDRDGAHDLEVVGVLEVDAGEDRGGADLRADLHRVDEPHLVEAVVDAHHDAVEALRRLLDRAGQVREQRQRQEPVRDRHLPRRELRCLLRVDVDELVVDRDIRELVDAVLRDLEPVAGAFCVTDRGLVQLESGLRLAPVVPSSPASSDAPREWHSGSCMLARGVGKNVGMPSKSSNVKNEKQYEALKDKGMSKERAAKISNSSGASSRGGKASGSGSSKSSSKQGGTTAQKKEAGRKGGKATAKKS